MWVNEVRNVNEAYVRGLSHLVHYGARQVTRAGEALVSPGPVVTVYERPRERVLFDARRDANPFFHLFESLWMLAGRNDVKPLLRYVKNFDQFAETDGTVHGAYGHRWRSALGFDQLDAVVERLRKAPGDRQAVIQMWDGRDEHSNDDPEFADVGCNDLLGSWKDRPCNTHIYLRVRPILENGTDVLDLTVCCRSNDAVWGAYGANAVHFSVLQEYLAGRIGVGVGYMYQLSNNFHAYTEVMRKVGGEPCSPGSAEGLVGGPYYSGLETMPIGTDWASWDADLAKFMAWHDALPVVIVREVDRPSYQNSWFDGVAQPMVMAHAFRKDPDVAGKYVRKIAAPDWRRAAGEWLNRRWRSK